MSQDQTQHVGRRLSFDGALCTVRYIGPVAGTSGSWLGVEWDDPVRGKHDGSHKDVRYFTCKRKSSTAASFVRPTRPAETPLSFIAALKDKYASESGQADGAYGARNPAGPSQIIISGKVAEEVGFDKIRRQQAQVKELKIVILDGQRVASAMEDGEPSIEETCPSITTLDLSRNPLESLQPVVEVCRSLPKLKNLSINGTRFNGVLDDASLCGEEVIQAFSGIRELGVGETMLGWDELCHIASRCPALSSLSAGANQLTTLHPVDYGTLSQTLTSLTLEYNDFTTFADLQGLTDLTTLRNLHLKGNNISTLAPPGSEAPIFPSSIQYIDVSGNDIRDWTVIDRLPHHFPGLTGLRISRNPVYETEGGIDTTTATDNTAASSSEESHMFTIARIAQLKSLNFTHITTSDRSNAEMFYLSRIAKQLATVPASAEPEIKAQHPRYAELCLIYGEPDVVRRVEINPAFLESRLVEVDFHGQEGSRKTTRIPKSTNIYAVKGIAGRLFGLPPLKLSLVWETGEWDPVAGFYDKDGDSSDEDMDELDVDQTNQNSGPESDNEAQEGKSGRWIKREVLLKDGPRQLGYCVDGPHVTIRVEYS